GAGLRRSLPTVAGDRFAGFVKIPARIVVAIRGAFGAITLVAHLAFRRQLLFAAADVVPPAMPAARPIRRPIAAEIDRRLLAAGLFERLPAGVPQGVSRAAVVRAVAVHPTQIEQIPIAGPALQIPHGTSQGRRRLRTDWAVK